MGRGEGENENVRKREFGTECRLNSNFPISRARQTEYFFFEVA